MNKKIKRNIIKIDEEKCNGCGLCVPACEEGALEIVDGKARLVNEIYCDGLGACLGECPEDAITIVEEEAAPFDEEATKKHLDENKGHEKCACPSAQTLDFRNEVAQSAAANDSENTGKEPSMLSHWPVKITLVNPEAPYFKDADLIITADCVPFAYAGFHRDYLKGKSVIIGCPKLDDIEFYQAKITEIIKQSDIRSISVIYMEVPCCFGLVHAAKQAISDSGKDIPFKEIKIGIRGEERGES
jgi:NAD-dependent dihydropyrimidine dehydrogenase PreA subunit